MAIYVPAGNWERAAETCRIVKAEEKDGYTNYVIEVRVTPFRWQVKRRYRQFVELHEKMVKNFSLDKHLLPPKKVFGNKSESFVSERQKALEFYLQTVIHQFSLLPEPLSKFLDFQDYEIRGITATLAETFFAQAGDILLSELKMYVFSPLDLHAVTERLKLSEPTFYFNNSKQDIAHLVEFITRLKHLKIQGSNRFFKESNIIPNSLSFDLALFKNLEILEIDYCNLEGNLISIDVLRKKLQFVDIQKSLKELSTFLLCGTLHWSPRSSSPQIWPIWHCITHANFSHNYLIKIDPSIKLLPSVTHLDLSYNDIQVIENLESLSHLSSLILSNNKISNLESLHTKLGNIQTLYLSSNKIKSLQGLSKLFSVTKLYLENNLISSLDDIVYLSKLPCIEELNLQNNPVTLNVDYRSHVLLVFGSQASEIQLDGSKATEKEIDTVSVLQALKQARGEIKSSPTSDVLQVNTISGLNSSHIKDALSGSNAAKDVCSEGKFSSKKPLANLAEASEFRQHVETLRRIGGSDWLRLLNEMNDLPKGSSKVTSERCLHNKTESSDLQLHTVPMFEKDNQLSSHHIKTLAVTSEIAYPECISLLDNSNENFRHQFLRALIKHRAFSSSENESIQQIQNTYSSLLSEAKLVWLVLLVLQESTVHEIPVCLIMFNAEMILLKVTSFSKDISSDSCCDSLLFPDFSYLRSLLPALILSVTIGPCNAYANLKTKETGTTETLIFLFNNTDMTDLFIEYCTKFYNIMPVYMQHPFTNNVLNFEEIHARLPLTNISFQNQILFNQRVLVSKVLHKCHFGILHYIFITPSHIVLVEERLHIPQVVGLDTTVQPQFHICALVNVHTNIKQIKDLKDIDSETDDIKLCDTEHACKQNADIENKRLEVLYKCGSWLIIEFESGVILYLKFFFLKQRNEFLEAFLYARSQK